jgi:hypothetical protein
VQTMSLQGYHQRLARGRIEHTPPLHLTRTHMECRIRDAVGREIEITVLVCTPQSICSVWV